MNIYAKLWVKVKTSSSGVRVDPSRTHASMHALMHARTHTHIHMHACMHMHTHAGIEYGPEISRYVPTLRLVTVKCHTHVLVYRKLALYSKLAFIVSIEEVCRRRSMQVWIILSNCLSVGLTLNLDRPIIKAMQQVLDATFCDC